MLTFSLQILTSGSVNFSLFTFLFKGHFTHMHDGGGTFVHASFLLIGEAKDIKSFLNYMIFGINIKIMSQIYIRALLIFHISYIKY